MYDEILYRLCRHNVGIMDGWHPYPSTAIANQTGISLNKVKYHLKKLKEQGLVKSIHEGGQTEDGEVFYQWGWTITRKAYETEEYKKAFEEERDLCKKCFDIDITSESETLEMEEERNER